MRVALGLVFAVLGCGGSSPAAASDAGDAVVDTAAPMLDTAPPSTSAVLRVTPASPLVALSHAITFHAVQALGDGTERDVTNQATFTVDDMRAGAFTASTFTSPTTAPGGLIGLVSPVHARTREAEGVAVVTVVFARSGDVIFIQDSCFDARATDPPNGILSFDARSSEHSVRVVPGPDAELIVSIGRATTCAAGKYCYVVSPDSAKLRARMAETTRFFRVSVEGVDATGTEPRDVTFVVLPKRLAPC